MTKMEPAETAFEVQFMRIPAWIQSRGNCTYLILRAVRPPTGVPRAQRRKAHLQPQNMRPPQTFRQKGICCPNRKDCSRKFDGLALFKKLVGLKQRFRQPSKKTGHANIHKARWRGIFT